MGKHRGSTGQGIVEYGLMIALLTVLVFAVIPLLPDFVGSLEFNSTSEEGKKIVDTAMDDCDSNDDDCAREDSDEDSDGDDDGCEDDPDSDEEEGEGDSDCNDDDDGEGDSDSNDDDA